MVSETVRTLLTMPPREVIARTAVGEADSLGNAGMQATINTAQNRVNSGVKNFGIDLVGCLTFPWQYSVWNAGNARIPFLLKMDRDDYSFCMALDLADQALAGTLDDITNGSTHYFNHLTVKNYPSSYLGINLFELEPHWYYRAKPY